MKRGVVLSLLITGVLFVAITVLKSRSSNEQKTGIPKAQLSVEEEAILLFWEYYREATDYRLAGHLDSAEVHYLRALQLNEHHEDALYYLGNIYLIRGKYKEAEDTWLRLSRLNPNSARSFSQLGSLYLCVEDTGYFNPSAARQAFQRAFEINKEETGPLLRLGQIALLQGDLSAASYYFDALMRSNHKSLEAYYYAGFIAWKNENMDIASKLFRQSVSTPKTRKQSDGIVGEGDTKAGGPLVLQQSSCLFFQNQFRDLASNDEAISRVQFSEEYRRFDAVLRSYSHMGHTRGR